MKLYNSIFEKERCVLVRIHLTSIFMRIRLNKELKVYRADVQTKTFIHKYI